MINQNALRFGAPKEVLENLTPEPLAAYDLQAALINAFERIAELERAVRSRQQTTASRPPFDW